MRCRSCLNNSSRFGRWNRRRLAVESAAEQFNPGMMLPPGTGPSSCLPFPCRPVYFSRRHPPPGYRHFAAPDLQAMLFADFGRADRPSLQRMAFIHCRPQDDVRPTMTAGHAAGDNGCLYLTAAYPSTRRRVLHYRRLWRIDRLPSCTHKAFRGVVNWNWASSASPR